MRSRSSRPRELPSSADDNNDDERRFTLVGSEDREDEEEEDESDHDHDHGHDTGGASAGFEKKTPNSSAGLDTNDVAGRNTTAGKDYKLRWKNPDISKVNDTFSNLIAIKNFFFSKACFEKKKKKKKKT